MNRDKCDVITCNSTAIHVEESQALGDIDYHDCRDHTLAAAQRHEAIAARLRRAVEMADGT